MLVRVFFITLEGDLKDDISETGLLAFVAVFGVVIKAFFT